MGSSFLYVWLDWLRWKEPDVGARIVKIRAEVKLQSQLAAAGGVIGLFQISAGGWSWASMGWVSLVLLGLVNYCRLYRIFELSILNHCAALEIRRGILDPNRTHARA